MNIFAAITLLGIVMLAVIQDLCLMKIRNNIILIGLILGMVFRIGGQGVSSVISGIGNVLFPILIFYLLFAAHIIGAGDIKLFSVIGSFVSFSQLVCCMAYAFLFGAVISFVLLVCKKDLWTGMKRALMYFVRIGRGERISYDKISLGKGNLMHFSVAIGLGLMVVIFRGCAI